jgi:hypothetical protein
MASEPHKMLISLLIITNIWIFIFYSTYAKALPPPLNYQLLTGYIDVAYTGPFSGSLNLGSTIDLNAEVITDDTASLFGHGTLSLDAETAVMKYMYAGIGRRIYVFSHASELSMNLDRSKIIITPKRQFFVSFEAGLGQVNVFSLTDSLSSIATVFEYGISAGMNWPVSKHIGLFSSIGVSQGYGFSSVTINSQILKAMFGVNLW